MKGVPPRLERRSRDATLRRVRLAAIALAVSAALLGSCGDAGEGAPGRVVTGTVLDAARRPVPGARLRVHPRTGDGAEGVADGQGRFEVPLGPLGSVFLLEATGPGFGPSYVDGVESRGGDGEVGPIYLFAPASLRGTVRTRGGEAIAGAEVFVSTGLPGREVAEARLALATSGSDGAFEVQGLPAGRARVGVRAAGFASEVFERVGLPPGEAATLEVALAPEAALEGIVLDDRGAPLAGARAVPTGGPRWPPVPAVQSDAEGRFRMRGLAAPPSGLRIAARGFPSRTFEPLPSSGRFAMERGRSITIRAERAGRPAPIARVRYEVHTRAGEGWRRADGEVDPEEREVFSPASWRFALPRGDETRLFVTAGDGSSARADSKRASDEEEVIVRFEAPIALRGRVEGVPSLEGLLVELASGGPGEESFRRALTGSDGAFAFDDAPAGGGEVRLRAPRAVAEPVPVPPAGGEVAIRAVEASRIRGRLAWGEEAPGEVVPIRAFRRAGRSPVHRWDLVAEGAAAPDGGFEIAPLSAGVTALLAKRPASLRDGGIRRVDAEWPRVEIEAAPSLVRVPAAGEATADLALPPMRPTDLEVAVAVNGTRRSGLRVDLLSVEGGIVGGGTTDEDGTARFRLDRGGSFEARVVGAGFREARRIEVADGAGERIDLEFHCGSARGVLLDAEGKGLPLRVDLERAGVAEATPLEDRVRAAVLADATGTFVFRDVVPGAYVAVAYDPQPGRATIGVGPFEVRAGEETDVGAAVVPREAPLRIALRSESGKFPFASARLRAASGEPPLPRPVEAWIPAGSALVRGLAPRRLVVELVLYGPWRSDAREREVALPADGTEAEVAFEVERTE